MEELLASITHMMDLNPGASDRLLSDAQAALGVPLPGDYLTFMQQHNGGSGWLGNSLLMLWPLEEVVEANQTLQVEEFAPGLIFFGGDGGEIGYAFDVGTVPLRIIRVDYLSMGDEDYTTICGRNFIEFLQFLRDETC